MDPLARRSAEADGSSTPPPARCRCRFVPSFPKEASPGSAIHPLGDRCRVGGDARRLFVDVDLAAAAGRADLEPGRSADAGGTHAAPRSAQTDREQVLPAEAIPA